RCFGYAGTFDQFVRKREHRRLRVLEVNEAGQLTQFLRELPLYTLARYPDVCYDLVVHSDTLEHVSQPTAALSECYRVLAPGGYCVFTVPVVVDRMTR